MPCFKGIAVSVHAEGAPLPEYSVQKQSRVARVNTFIPVPQAKIPSGSTTNKPEPSKFAISITLLTAGLPVPYSTPKSTPSDPYPRPHIVAGLPTTNGDRGQYGGVISPYIPITKSENETIAAYIYFDGRPKEEVATLLRPGEETWVNSRWVQVPDSEGGGLAEREFLFKEVGLERWLNGLDLEGHDAAAKIERRRQKFEKRRRRKIQTDSGSDDELANAMTNRRKSDILKYGNSESSPVERLSEDDDMSEDSSDDDDAPPEATGQIKVAMFRVLASGEIKRGEYSPQFDAHDDDDLTEGNGGSNGNEDGADVDHTTSFAKPKTLDPKSISTQTVTGIDGPDKPYAVFTFFYRGERQLQKMGVLESSKSSKAAPGSTKRRSTQLDFGKLAPLKSTGTVGYTQFRDNDPEALRKTKSNRKKSNGSVGGAMNEDSDEDDDDLGIVGKMEDVDDKDIKTMISPEDAKYSGEIAEGVGRIKLKRQHSAEPLAGDTRKSPGSFGNTPPESTIESTAETPNLNIIGSMFAQSIPEESIIGSPMKKQRASIYGASEEANGLPPMANVLGNAENAAQQQQSQAQQTALPPTQGSTVNAEEEL